MPSLVKAKKLKMSTLFTVLGQNGIWTKWYTDKIVLDKMVYGQNSIGQNGVDKMVQIKYYG